MRRALVAMALMVLLPGRAAADTEVGGVVVERPDSGRTIDLPVVVVLMGAGVPAETNVGAGPGVTVWLLMDGTPVDPETGELVERTIPPFVLAPGERRRVEVRGVGPGRHTLTVEVSASPDEFPEVADIPFAVTPPARNQSLAFALILGGIVLLFVLARRRVLRPPRFGGAAPPPDTVAPPE
jgi:hypothetical protein